MNANLILSVLTVLVFESILVSCIAVPLLHARPMRAIALLTVTGAVLTCLAPLGRCPLTVHIWTVAWVPWLSTFSKLLGADGSPETRFWKKDEEPRTTLTPTGRLRHKLCWHLNLIHSFRGIGWNWQIRDVPASRILTPVQFFSMNMVRLAVLWLMYDSLNHVTTALYTPLLSTRDISPPTIRHHTWIRDAVHKICFGLLPLLQLNIIFISISTVAVVLGLSKTQV